ncbi:MAG: hypothetical protein ACR2P2_15405 [Nakamurella sp.]
MPDRRLSSRPLLGIGADTDLFTGRTVELRRAARAVSDRLNCVFVGDPGAGRTSVLHQLLATTAPPFVLVRGASAVDAGELLGRVSDELRSAGHDDPAPPAADDRRTFRPDPPATADLIDRVRRQSEGVDGLVIAIDDLTPDAGLDLFGRHRDEVWTIGASWIATVSSAHATSLLRPPADVFFEVRVDLEPLSDEESIALLRKRLPIESVNLEGDGPADDDGRGLGRIVGSSSGNPRRLIELARLLDDADIRTVIATTDATLLRDAVIARASAPARMLAKELATLGSASASDGLLLDRLGWTRPRAVQVLKELEAAGVVVAVDQRTGRGRPRKVYRLVADG